MRRLSSVVVPIFTRREDRGRKRKRKNERVLGTRDRVSDDERPSERAAQFVRGPEDAPTEGLQTEV